MPRIFDCFTFYNELDLLDIRLHEHDRAVDHFVIVEATRTFRGKPKPLFFLENKERYSAFLDKIIHIVVDFPEALPASRFLRRMGSVSTEEDNAWHKEFYQRDQIMRGLETASPDDLVIISDVDEIIETSKLAKAAAAHQSNELTVFTMPLYIFQLSRRVRGRVWKLGPRMLQRQFIKSAQEVRMARLNGARFLETFGLGQQHARLQNWLDGGLHLKPKEISNAGWHFSSIGDWSNLMEKLGAFSHVETAKQAEYASEEAYKAHLAQETELALISEMPSSVKNRPLLFKEILGIHI